MHQAVVRSRPEEVRLEGRFGQGEDGAVDLGAGVVLGDRTAGGLEGGRVVAGEIGGDRFPGGALVGGAEDDVRGGVEGVRVVGRKQRRRRPVEPVAEVFGAPAGVLLWPYCYIAQLADGVVVAGEQALVAAGVDNIRVVGADGDVARFAPADLVPLGDGDRVVIGAAGDAHGRVVLLGAVDAVGRPGVCRDVVHLGGRLVVEGRPGEAAVEGDGAAAVVAQDHALRVGGVDPEVVVVAVGRGDLMEGGAAVDGAPHFDVQAPDGIRVLRVGREVGVVPGALAEVAVLVEALPGLAAVVGAEDAPLLVLDQGPNAVGLGGGDGDADLALDPLGHAGLVGKVGPGFAAVG